MQAAEAGPHFSSGGEGEIRTHEPRKGPPVFKTGAFNHSATSPYCSNLGLGGDFTRQSLPCPAAKALNGGHLPLYQLQPGLNRRLPPWGC
jgi:hypothetical protein